MKILIFFKKLLLKQLLLFLFVQFFTQAKAQKIESLKIDLYTDSLKKGTYNYINIDGKLSSGRYIPLDTSDITLTSSDGKFSGNSLWIEPSFKKEKVLIKAVSKSDPAMYKEFTMFIKQKPDDEKLKTMDELMNEKLNTKPSHKRNK